MAVVVESHVKQMTSKYLFSEAIVLAEGLIDNLTSAQKLINGYLNYFND